MSKIIIPGVVEVLLSIVERVVEVNVVLLEAMDVLGALDSEVGIEVSVEMLEVIAEVVVAVSEEILETVDKVDCTDRLIVGLSTLGFPFFFAEETLDIFERNSLVGSRPGAEAIVVGMENTDLNGLTGGWDLLASGWRD